jgi:membrane protein
LAPFVNLRDKAGGVIVAVLGGVIATVLVRRVWPATVTRNALATTIPSAGAPDTTSSGAGQAAPRENPASPTEIPAPGWRDILRRALQQFKHDAITDRAAALTYFGVLAIFPGLIVVVSILGLLGRSTTNRFLANVESLAPGSVKSFLTTAIEQTQNRPGTAGAATAIGVVLAIWSASGYIAAFMRATNQIYSVDEGRPIWKTAPIRLAVTVAIVVMLIVTVLMVVVTGSIASQVGKALGIGHTAVLVWDFAKWPVLLVIVSLMLSLLYWACPNVKQPGFRWYTPGGALAVVIWLIASGGFGLYVSFAGSYNKTYGSLASIIIFLVWLWITNIAILLGAEFNAEVEHQRAIEAGLPEEVEPFVEVRDTRKLDDDERERVELAARQLPDSSHGGAEARPASSADARHVRVGA